MQKSDDEKSPLRKSLPEVTRELGSHLYLYQILDETPNGVMVVSLKHQVLYANPAANGLLGVAYRNLVDTDLEVLLGPENQWFFLSDRSVLRQSGGDPEVENQAGDPDQDG